MTFLKNTEQSYTGKIKVAVEISASRSRVWRALSQPSQVTVWDTGIIEVKDAPADYPQPGQHVQWQYQLGPIAMTLHDFPLQAVENELLQTRIKLGILRYLETYTLVRDDDRNMTQLTAEMFVGNALPLFGRVFDHLIGIPVARSTVKTSLWAIKTFCEKNPS